jgi:ABC-type glycerol-3-phosphate transport system permease component
MTPRVRTWDVSVGRGLRVLVIVLLAMWAVIELYPVIFMFHASLKTDQEILGSPFSLAIPPRTESYAWRPSPS